MGMVQGSLPTGKLAKRVDPYKFAAEVVKPPQTRRIVGIDLGTNCGFAFCDFNPDRQITDAQIVGGIWDLSVSTYDSGPLRHIRMKQFLAVTAPDLIVYEDVVYTPPLDVITNRRLGPAAVVARVARPLEFLGGLKVTLTTWAEEQGVPAHGIGIGTIKQFATGKGVANKAAMITAANQEFGLDLEVEDHARTGNDNIADALFCCAYGVNNYADAYRQRV